jgi:hypothetical protein
MPYENPLNWFLVLQETYDLILNITDIILVNLRRRFDEHGELRMGLRIAS